MVLLKYLTKYLGFNFNHPWLALLLRIAFPKMLLMVSMVLYEEIIHGQITFEKLFVLCYPQRESHYKLTLEKNLRSPA